MNEKIRSKLPGCTSVDLLVAGKGASRMTRNAVSGSPHPNKLYLGPGCS